MADRERELRTDHLVSDIRRRSVRGGAIMLAAQAAKVVAQFGAVAFLARLLPPEDFGLIAMIAALSVILDLVKEFGLSAATIQKSDITHAQVSALFWINALVGSAITLGLVLAAPTIAAFYRQPALTSLTRWLAFGFLLSGLTTQHWALLRRQMRFAAVATVETGAELVGFAVAILLATRGAGYWALVAQRLTGPTLVLLGSWTLCRWRPDRPAYAAGIGALCSFGASVTGTNLMVALARNVDQILIGWLWGPSALGFYERASKLLLVPINNINGPLYAVAMPMLSRLGDQDARYRRAFGEMLEKLAMITMPAAALVTVTADWVVDLLFGSHWKAAAPLVACFGFTAVYQPAVLAVGLLYLSQNRPRELLRATLIDGSLTILSILTGLSFGATGVAVALAGVGLILRTPLAFWLSSRRGPVGLADLYDAVRPSALAALSVAAAVWLLRRAILPAAAAAPIGLAAAVPTALLAAVFVFYLLPRSRASLMMFYGALHGLPRLMRSAARQ